MAKTLLHSFGLKLANKTKTNNIATVISRRCLALIIKIGEKYRAKINNKDREIIIELTNKSYDLKGKCYVFSRNKDENGKHILIIRTIEQATIHPGINTQYITVKENCIISGFIVRLNGKMYFDYEELIALSPNSNHINVVNIDSSKPLFK